MNGALTPDYHASEEADLLQFIGLLGRSVETALRAHRVLLTELLQARAEPATALDRAGLASRRCVRAFDEALLRLNRARVPPAAHDAARELRCWLEAHVEACDHLNRASVARDRQDLAQAIQCLASTPPYAQCFNSARDRLVRHLAGRAASAN